MAVKKTAVKRTAMKNSTKSSTDNSKTKKTESKKSPLVVTKKSEKKIKILSCGKAKSGKTTFAGTFPKPVFIDTDHGTASVPDGVPCFEFFRINDDNEKDKDVLTRFKDVLDIISDLRTKDGPYYEMLEEIDYEPETIVLDSLSSLCDLIEAEIIRTHDKTKPNADSLWMNDYSTINTYIVELLYYLRDLTDYHVIVISGIDSLEDDLGRIIEQPMASGKKLGAKVAHIFDEVYKHYYNEKEEMWYLTPQQDRRFQHSGSRYVKLKMQAYPNPTYDSIVKKRGK